MLKDAEKLTAMYRRMVTIRRFEEAVWDLYTQGKMKGLAHLYIGQEAVAVGACAALDETDYITSTHRGHGHVIAKGAQVDRMMAEILGKESGYNRGKGGTMHIADMSLGILGANGIVGGSMGIATGAAFSAKMRKSGQVALCFFGDGAANQGLFLEAANLASIWKLPVIFLCENNQYGEYTPVLKVTAVKKDLAERACAFNMPGVIADGTDLLDVYAKVREAVTRARQGEGPTLVECKTYRYRGHHVGDPGRGYRSDEEIQDWHQRDCIERFARRLSQEGVVDRAAIERLDKAVATEIENAVAFALEAPFPKAEEVRTHVYTD